MSLDPASLVLAIFPACLLTGVINDVKAFRIPNHLSVILLLTFFAAAMLGNLEMTMITGHLTTFGLTLAVGFVIFALGYIGAGDVKIFAAAALWLGPAGIWAAVLYSTVAGGLLSLWILKVQNLKYTAPKISALIPKISRLNDGTQELPYGLAICAGCLLAFPYSDLFKAFI